MTVQQTETSRFEWLRRWLRRPLFWVLAPLVLLLLLVVLLIGVYVAGHFLNEIKLDRQREALGSFVAPTEWEELTHPVYAGPFSDSFCMLPALFCNYHHSRRWTTAEPPSAAELRAMAEASGWKEIEFSPENRRSGACEDEEKGEGSTWCPLRAVSGRVSFEFETFPVRSVGGLWYVRLSAY